MTSKHKLIGFRDEARPDPNPEPTPGVRQARPCSRKLTASSVSWRCRAVGQQTFAAVFPHAAAYRLFTFTPPSLEITCRHRTPTHLSPTAHCSSPPRAILRGGLTSAVTPGPVWPPSSCFVVTAAVVSLSRYEFGLGTSLLLLFVKLAAIWHVIPATGRSAQRPWSLRGAPWAAGDRVHAAR